MKKNDLINLMFLEKVIADEGNELKNWLPYFPKAIQESIIKQKRYDEPKRTYRIDDFINYNMNWDQTTEGRAYWTRMCDCVYVVRNKVKGTHRWEELYDSFFNRGGPPYIEDEPDDEGFREEDEDERF